MPVKGLSLSIPLRRRLFKNSEIGILDSPHRANQGFNASALKNIENPISEFLMIGPDLSGNCSRDLSAGLLAKNCSM
jgi:hypothetical protein